MKKRLLFSLVVCGLLSLSSTGVEKRKAEEAQDEPHQKVKMTPLQKGHRWVEIEGELFQLAEQYLNNSTTLSDFIRLTRDYPNDPIPLPNITKNVWEQFIIPALKEGEGYTVPEGLSIQDIIVLSNASDYLAIPYLYQKSLDRLKQQLQNNIHKIDKGNLTQLLNDMRYDLAKYIVATCHKGIVLRGHKDAVTGMDFTFDGKIISGSQDKELCLWDVTLEKPLKKYSNITQPLSLAASKQNPVCAIADQKTIELLDVSLESFGDKKEKITAIGGIGGLAIRSETVWFFDDYGVATWNRHLSAGNRKKHVPWVMELAVADDGLVYAYADAYGIYIDSGAHEFFYDIHKKDHVTALALGVDATGDQIVVSGDENGVIAIYNVPKKTYIKLGAIEPITTIDVDFQRGVFVSGNDQGYIAMWDLGGSLIKGVKVVNNQSIQSVKISPNGRWLAVAAGNDIYVYDIEQARDVNEMSLDELIDYFKDQDRVLISEFQDLFVAGASYVYEADSDETDSDEDSSDFDSYTSSDDEND